MHFFFMVGKADNCFQNVSVVKGSPPVKIPDRISGNSLKDNYLNLF